MDWIVYSRPGCHLCETALAWIDELAEEWQAPVRVINILDDPGAYAAYRWTIPVLQIGQHRWAAPLDESAVRTAVEQVLR